jgi:hypothetical protein
MLMPHRVVESCVMGMFRSLKCVCELLVSRYVDEHIVKKISHAVAQRSNGAGDRFGFTLRRCAAA